MLFWMRNGTSLSLWPNMPWSPPNLSYEWMKPACLLDCLLACSLACLSQDQKYCRKKRTEIWKCLKLKHGKAIWCFIALMALWCTWNSLVCSLVCSLTCCSFNCYSIACSLLVSLAQTVNFLPHHLLAWSLACLLVCLFGLKQMGNRFMNHDN